MADVTNATKIITSCNALKTFWNKRNARFKDWYRLIQMVDELEQKDMESFVGNDPRAAFNLTTYMLDQTIPHRIPSDDIDRELIGAASVVENFFTKQAWPDIHDRFRRGPRQSWMRHFIGLLIATGWYSVFAMVTQDGTRVIADILNPASVFPSWDDDLVEVAIIRSLSNASAKRLADRNKWPVKVPTGGKVVIYDYWKKVADDKVTNTIVLGTDLVKPEALEPRFAGRIPIFIGACGGLPDSGIIMGDDAWIGEIGQSSLSTNEKVYRQWNKWWSFAMQLLRDTAQPRIMEFSSSTQRIVNPQDVFRRGAIFKGGPNDRVEYLTPPPIPLELRSTQIDLEAQLQKGQPPAAMFGMVQQQLTSYVMSQIAAAANQMARPYHGAVINLLGDIDNFWLDMIRRLKDKPYGFEIPKELPEDVRITASYEIKIPGDFINRLTAARMANPDFKLNTVRVYEELFPEVSNPLEEMAKVRADDAQRHPMNATIALIESFRQTADILVTAGNREGARLYSMAADRIEQTLGIAEEPEQQRPPIGGRPEATPQQPAGGLS